MASRWLQKDFLLCTRCQFIHRYVEGYRPIPNPILFKTDAHCKQHFDQQRKAAWYVGLPLTAQCPGCTKRHSQWTVLTFQQVIDRKEAKTGAKVRIGSLSGARSTAKKFADIQISVEEQLLM